MRVWIDEDLSPQLTTRARALGIEATCVRDRGLLRSADWELMPILLAEEWVLVTNNAGDFLVLAEREGLHPGLIFLPLGSAARCADHLEVCIRHVVASAGAVGEAPAIYMTNRVIDVREDGCVEDYCWPQAAS